MRAAAVMRASARLGVGSRPVEPLRMVLEDVVIWQDMTEGHIGDHPNALGVGLVEHLLDQVAPVELGMCGPEGVGEHGPFAGAAEPDSVGMVLTHHLDQPLRIERQVWPEGRVVVVHQEDACPSNPFVIGLHGITSLRLRERHPEAVTPLAMRAAGAAAEPERPPDGSRCLRWPTPGPGAI